MSAILFKTLLAASAATALAFGFGPGAAHAQAPTVVPLTQVACQFVEPEGGDRAYAAASKEECDALNARTAAGRAAAANVLELKPGQYVFRVTNRDVPYELGFWLREKGFDWRNPIHQVSKLSVSGAGLMMGKTQDYAVDLKPGEYVFSCPLNTTPDYRLVVRGG